jgi:hypothetical protein
MGRLPTPTLEPRACGIASIEQLILSRPRPSASGACRGICSRLRLHCLSVRSIEIHLGGMLSTMFGFDPCVKEPPFGCRDGTLELFGCFDPLMNNHFHICERFLVGLSIRRATGQLRHFSDIGLVFFAPKMMISYCHLFFMVFSRQLQSPDGIDAWLSPVAHDAARTPLMCPTLLDVI